MPLWQRQEVQALPRETELNRYPTLAEDGNDAIRILDQTCLPGEAVTRRLTTLQQVANAISTMQVRGAPLIGATAAYGVALAMAHDTSDAALAGALAALAASRPTAVNLRWALDRQRAALETSAVAQRRSAAWNEARAIAALDVAANAQIGRHGLDALRARCPADGRPWQLMTHCNAGRLATVDHGTALAPIYRAHAEGIAVHVWVSETRPRNQGLLTCWELAQAGVPHTLIADNAAGLLMMQGQVDAVIVGADRIAANGDVANKVGTYLKALAAKAANLPFFVAAPVSTIDFACADGAGIPIEKRAADEFGFAGVAIANPAFDITPAACIGGIISERGISPPDRIASWRT